MMTGDYDVGIELRCDIYVMRPPTEVQRIKIKAIETRLNLILREYREAIGDIIEISIAGAIKQIMEEE